MKKSQVLWLAAVLCVMTSGAGLAKGQKSSTFFCESDCKMEFKFFRNYAREGSSLADLMLAVMYYQGKGIGVNNEKGNYHLFKAARADEPGAQFQLGYFLMHGMYMERDLEQAISWFERADSNNKKGAKEKIAIIQGWQNSGEMPVSLFKQRVAVGQLAKNGSATVEPDIEPIETILVIGDFSYSQVLSAAKDQTCNMSCPPVWNFVTAPLIALPGDDL